MSITLYTDWLSQHCRAVGLFMSMNNIPFEARHVDIFSKQAETREFAEITYLRSVPTIDEDSFRLTGSEAILKYIAGKRSVAKHWYPNNARVQARVDEYLSWQHTGIHEKVVRSMRETKIIPGEPKAVRRQLIEETRKVVDNELRVISSYFLKDGDYIAGEGVTIADISCCAELDTVGLVYDLRAAHPALVAYLRRVSDALHPHHSTYTRLMEEAATRYMGAPRGGEKRDSPSSTKGPVEDKGEPDIKQTINK